MPTRHDRPPPEVMDYNGTSAWSRHAILDRYAQYVPDLPAPYKDRRDLSPDETVDDGVRRIYPVIDKVIDGIRAGDPACARLGVEYLEQDEHFPFGLTQRVYTARALRRISLTDDLKERIHRRVFGLLADGRVERGFKGYKEYAKLVRAIGFTAADLPAIEHPTPLASEFLRYFRGLQHAAR